MSRKRVNKKEENKQEIKYQVKPLMEYEAKYFQELVDSSNYYAGLLKQRAQYEFIIKQLQNNRKKIQDGKVKPPFLMTLIPKVLSHSVEDKKEILELFDEHIKGYQQSLKAIIGQLEHRYEDYVEAGIRTQQFLEKKFRKEKVKRIAPDRKTANAEEETIFEAEFEELLKNEELQKKFKDAKKEAVKKNVARKTKATKTN